MGSPGVADELLPTERHHSETPRPARDHVETEIGIEHFINSTSSLADFLSGNPADHEGTNDLPWKPCAVLYCDDQELIGYKPDFKFC